jgi:hypothetical protein
VSEAVFLNTPKRTKQAILGQQFARKYELIINFEYYVSYVREGVTKEYSFSPS